MANELLELEEITINSCMRIDSSQPMVIDLKNRKKGQNLVEFVGNQGVGKTSSLIGIVMLMGGTIGIEKKDLFNNVDEDINLNEYFTYEGEKYYTEIKKGRLSVVKQLDEAADKWSKPIDEPMTFLKKIFGPVGLSPLSVREMDGAKQIKYFRDMFGSGEDASKKQLKIEADLKKVFDERTENNKEIKSLKGWLDQSDLFSSYEKNLKKFATPINAEKEKKKFDELSTKKNGYEKYANTVTITESDLKDRDRQIAELEARLVKLKEERVALAEGVETGKKWLETNKGVLKEYEDANKAWLNLSKDMADQLSWKEVLKKEKEYNEALQLEIQQTSDVEKYRKDLLKLTKSYLPDVPGLEIRVKSNGIDKTKEDEGVFLNGISLIALSQSVYEEMWMDIYDAKGIRFMFLENTTSMGSGVVDTANRLLKSGVVIFASTMDRTKKKAEVVFKSKLV